MAALTGNSPSSTFHQLLQMGSSNTGLLSTLQPVQDGSGTSSILQLSTSQVDIDGIFSVTGNTLAVLSASSINGNNTGDQSLAGDVTGSATSVITTTISSNAVTYAKMQQGAARTLIGNSTASIANVTAITLGATLGFSGTVLQTLAHVGDATSAANSNTMVVAAINGATLGTTTATSGNILIGSGTQWVTRGVSGDATINSTGTLTLGTNTVTYAKMQQVAAHKLLGNTTGSIANITEIPTSTFLQSLNKQLFAASGTYTPTANMVYCIIECIGGGGGGGGCANSGAAAENMGGGGGGGGYSKITVSAATIGASQTVTIGAAGQGGASGSNPGNNGGTTSVGTICIANGGTGGAASSPGATAAGGAGGTAGTGDIATTGQTGQLGIFSTVNTSVVVGGMGGNSGGGLGQGATSPSANSGGNGATGYGGGGGGGYTTSASGARGGGAGSIGYVLITEFIAV